MQSRDVVERRFPHDLGVVDELPGHGVPLRVADAGVDVRPLGNERLQRILRPVERGLIQRSSTYPGRSRRAPALTKDITA